MAEKSASRKGDSANASSVRSANDPPLRLVNPEGQIVFDDVSPSDEAPTIISKSQVVPPAEPPVLGTDGASLRGRKLAHFELLEPIGVGGMAAVLRARDTQLDRFVALKILPPEMARDHENVRRFHQEARAAAKLDHENIARVFFCGEDQGLHFIAFEYVEGDNLRVILERRGRLPVAEAIGYLLQVAAGLEHAATRGVVHRDVKPSNIIVSPSGRAKLVDMGLARSLEPHADNGLTQSGVTLGTFDYISPEQALEPREADSRSDIYSLGCTFYHMLTGQAPVPEGTAAKKLQHHQHVAPIDPRQLNPEIPDEVAFILSKMMAKNPRDRFQRPAHLVQKLMQVAQKVGASTEMSPEAMFVDVNMPTEPQRRPIVLVSLAALGLAALLFLLSLAPQGKQSSLEAIRPTVPAVVPPSKTDTPPRTVVPTTVSNRTTVESEDDLRHALESRGDGKALHLIVAGDIVLSGALVIEDKSGSLLDVTIAGSDASKPSKLSHVVGAVPSRGTSTGLRIRGAKVVFRNLHFELSGNSAVQGPKDPAAMIAVSGSGDVRFERCTFDQIKIPADVAFIKDRDKQVPIASILCETSGAKESPQVTLTESYFSNGQAGVAVAGPGSPGVEVIDCAFFNVSNPFHLRGGRPDLRVVHCSTFLRSGPAFRIDGAASAKLRVEYSLFSRPSNLRGGDETNLIHQTDSVDTNRLTYLGMANGYHNLQNLWVVPNQIQAYEDLDKFRQLLQPQGSDRESVILPREGPSPFRLKGEAGRLLAEAFELNPAARDLQSLVSGRTDDHRVPGVRSLLAAHMPTLHFIAETPAGEYKPAANERVVDPDLTQSKPNHFRSFSQALLDLTPGEVISLKATSGHTEFVLRQPLDVEGDLTIRGYSNAPPGTPPTSPPVELRLYERLVSDPHFFRLLQGKLQLENLHLVLEPTHDGPSQTLVAMISSGTCSLKNCVITLKGRDRASGKGMVPLSVVTLLTSEDAKMMMTDAKAAVPPQILVQDCYIRGEGDFLTVSGSRPLQLQIQQSLVYLHGALVHQSQGAARELSSPEAAMSLRLTHSSFLLSEPLLWLQSGKMQRNQYPVRVDPVDQCLFASLGEHPLIALDIPEVTDKNLQQIIDWKGHKDVYLHFDKNYLLVSAPADEGLRPLHLDGDAWVESFYRNGAEAKFYLQGLTRPAGKNPSQTLPEELKLRPDVAPELQSYFDPFARLPVPRRVDSAN